MIYNIIYYYYYKRIFLMLLESIVMKNHSKDKYNLISTILNTFKTKYIFFK